MENENIGACSLHFLYFSNVYYYYFFYSTFSNVFGKKNKINHYANDNYIIGIVKFINTQLGNKNNFEEKFFSFWKLWFVLQCDTTRKWIIGSIKVRNNISVMN